MKKMTTTEVNDVVGTFVVKLLGMRTKTNFKNIQLPLNENKNNLDEKLNDSNYNRAVMKLHDDDWKTIFSLILMFLCLVMDVVCLSILNFIMNI